MSFDPRHFKINLPANKVKIQELVDKQSKDFEEFNGWFNEIKLEAMKRNMDPLALRKAMIFQLHLQTEAAMMVGKHTGPQLEFFDAQCSLFAKREIEKQKHAIKLS